MRGLWLLLVVAGVGCTRLNGAFDQSSDAVTGSGGTEAGTTSGVTSGTSSPPGDETSTGSASTTKATADDSSPPPELTTTESSTSRDADSDPGGTSSTTSEPAPTPAPTDPILVIYAAEGWASGFTPGSPVSFSADMHCQNDPVFSNGDLPCDLGNTLRGFVRSGDGTIDGFLNGTPGIWAMLPVYGAQGGGAAPLAPDLESLVMNGPEVSLSSGGVTAANPGNGFWSGGLGPPMPNCEAWSSTSDASAGTYGLLDSTGDTWFYADEAPCIDTKPILCICDATFGELTN